MVLNGAAHGKLLLFGEHAVVHGYPALGLSLPMRTHVCMSPQGDTPLDTQDQAPLVAPLVPYMGPTAGGLWRQQTWHVRIDSNVPMGCGLGSSAALTGALARAFASGMANPQSDAIWRMAHQAESFFHGNPSGVDTALALGEGLVACFPVHQTLPKTVPCAISAFAMVVGFVPRTTNTRDLVAHVQNQIRIRRNTTLAMLSQLGNLAVLPDVTEPAWALLGDRANKAQALLWTLGLSTPALDEILSTGQAAGACGGKLSGAGGGGAFVLFCKNLASAHEVALAVSPYCTRQATIYQWDGHGVLTFGEGTS